MGMDKDKDLFAFCFWVGFACEAVVSLFAGYVIGAAVASLLAVWLTLASHKAQKPINVVAMVLLSSLLGVAGAVLLSYSSSMLIGYLLY